MSSISNLEEIIRLAESAKLDSVKALEKGNVRAGVRLRATLAKIKIEAQYLREESLESARRLGLRKA